MHIAPKEKRKEKGPTDDLMELTYSIYSLITLTKKNQLKKNLRNYIFKTTVT